MAVEDALRRDVSPTDETVARHLRGASVAAGDRHAELASADTRTHPYSGLDRLVSTYELIGLRIQILLSKERGIDRIEQLLQFDVDLDDAAVVGN